MKTQLLFIIALLFSLLMPSIVFSADGRICQQGIYVIFGNGVWNDKEAADGSRLLLASRLESRISGTDLEGLITYATAHNPSDGKLLDLLETFEQNSQTDTSQFWRYLAGLDPLPDFLQDKLVDELILNN